MCEECGPVVRTLWTIWVLLLFWEVYVLLRWLIYEILTRSLDLFGRYVHFSLARDELGHWWALLSLGREVDGVPPLGCYVYWSWGWEGFAEVGHIYVVTVDKKGALFSMPKPWRFSFWQGNVYEDDEWEGEDEDEEEHSQDEEDCSSAEGEVPCALF